MFSNFRNQMGSPLNQNCSPKEKLVQLKKEDFVTESSFILNMIKIYIGELDKKMQFTFEMYDFDNDGYITSEDVRIMMSYMAFNRGQGI